MSDVERDRRLDEAALRTLFTEARSYNGYLDRPIEEGLLREIWCLASLGPTSANMSPARIVWCVGGAARGVGGGAPRAPRPGYEQIPLYAPVTAIIGMDYDFADRLPYLFPHVDARPWFTGSEEVIATNAMRNSTLQGAYLIMAARALGLDTGPMSGFDNASVDEAFFAGTRIRSNFIATLGYGDRSSIFDRLPRLSFDEATRII